MMEIVQNILPNKNSKMLKLSLKNLKKTKQIVRDNIK
jgi:hypothetical protein